MKHLIDKYLKAWETKNINLLEEVLTPNFKGIWTLFEEKLYNLDDVIYTLKNPREIRYTLLTIEEKNKYSYVDCFLNINGENQLITMKFSFENDLIDSVYETKKLENKTRIKCIVSYDGSTFNGYQKQPNKNTIQDSIELAIFKATKENVLIHSSGRTDKGVHANNQVFHFDTSSKINPDRFNERINAFVDDGIYVKSSEEVHETFHSRYDIMTKEYYYVINKEEYDVIKRNYEWYPDTFNVDKFKDAINILEGTHDFTSFTKTNDKSNIRTIYEIKFIENDKYLYTYIKGNGFLRYMIRNIIAAGMVIAKDKTHLNMRQILNKKDNSLIKDIAPASGLYMNEVTYND